MQYAKPPYLHNIYTPPSAIVPDTFPYTIPSFKSGVNLSFESAVTLLVGENGCGKSTLLEAIAEKCGFNPLGGNCNHTYGRSTQPSRLAMDIRITWSHKTHKGFFLRAESFFNFADYIDALAADDENALAPYGGKSLHHQSHGEAFLSLFSNKFTEGLFILDEPEAALSPSRQLSLLVLINRLVHTGKAQFIIATHSPLLLTYPAATILSFTGEHLSPVIYQDTEHYQLTKRFLDNPTAYFQHLFSG